MLSFNWSSRMTMKMRNSQVQRGVIVQQMKQRWSCYNQCPSGRLLGVEPDYLVYFVSQFWTLFLNGAATLPVIKHCLGDPRRAVATLWSPPLAGGFWGSAPKAKNICKIAL